jgi:glycosyltransferase involved in cell wall biosynthesis
LLVIAGGRRGAVFAPVAGKAEAPARVIRLGPVGDAELKALYGAAIALVFASSYEGFGLPPLEAMSCDCPVLASSATAVPEVCGDAALYVDPDSPPDIARRLGQIMADDGLRADLIVRGRVRFGLFTWRAAAARLQTQVQAQALRLDRRLEGSSSLQVLPARAGRDGRWSSSLPKAGATRRRPGRALRRTGRRTVVETRLAGYRVTRAASWGSVLATSVAPALLGHLRELQQGRDLVHVHMPDPLAAAALWRQPTPAKLIVHWHSDVVRQRMARRLYEPLQQWLLSRADAIVATSAPYAASSPWLKRWSARPRWCLSASATMRVAAIPRPPRLSAGGSAIGGSCFRSVGCRSTRASTC